jgi:hypothetical protein
MRRWNFADICTAGFFFAVAALFAWVAYDGLMDARCTLDGTQPCSISDMESRTYGMPLIGCFAIAGVILGLRVLSNMRHGE